MCEVKLEFSCHNCGRTKKQPHVHDPYKMVIDYKPPEWDFIGSGDGSGMSQLWCDVCVGLYWQPSVPGGVKHIQFVGENERSEAMKTIHKTCICLPHLASPTPGCPVHGRRLIDYSVLAPREDNTNG